MALMREALRSDPDFEGKSASAIKTEAIGSTLLACAYPWGFPECAWFADASLNVFKGLGRLEPRLANQFLQDYLGAARSIPTA